MFRLYLAGGAERAAHVGCAFLESRVQTARAVCQEIPPRKCAINLLSSRAEAMLHEHETARLHKAKHLAHDFLRVTTAIHPITGKHQVKPVGVESFQELLTMDRRLGGTLGSETPVAAGQRVKADKANRLT
ncbi:MAG: hypothetical protein M1376_17335, partial [Planctomycetes bacterium]|nr:hypothetical protein [Planctomycetota bacterium]